MDINVSPTLSITEASYSVVIPIGLVDYQLVRPKAEANPSIRQVSMTGFQDSPISRYKTRIQDPE